VDPSTTILGSLSPLPIALAPIGALRMVRDEGELAVARAAAAAGIPYAVPTMATVPFESIARAVDSPLWFQLYLPKDRGLARDLIGRVRSSGYRALIVTVDTPAVANRERDLRNRFAMGSVGSKALLNGLRHPQWWVQFARGSVLSFPNVEPDVDGRDPAARYGSTAVEMTPTWGDVDWIAAEWGGPLVIKGVLAVADARDAVAAGAAGIVISNHGGRQLDSAPATIDVLSPIVDAIGDDAEVLLDSGVRRGVDVLCAIAHGARACLIGRPYVYGLAAAGQEGVEHAIGLIGSEIRTAMMLLGVVTPHQLDRSYVHRHGITGASRRARRSR
jgi:L-lactate dehydrogenase (cytochrome)